MKKTAFAAALLLTLAACGNEADPEPDMDGAQPIETRDVTEQEIEQATEASLNNSIEILRRGGESNMAISPASLSYALAMAGEGAQCETQTEINEFLGVADEARASVYTGLTENIAGGSDRYVTDFRSVIADNSDRDTTDTDKLKSVALTYGSDYVEGSPGELNETLGEWVSDATGGRQESLPAAMPETMEAAFISAMRYETEWRDEPSSKTYDFTTLAGETVDVDGYGMSGTHSGWRVDGGTIIRLKTASPDSTYVYYPDEVMDPALIDGDDWDTENGEPIDVLLSVPAIDIETKTDVLEHKDEIGLANIDDTTRGCGLADYSAIEETIAIEIIVQNATFRLDDEGIAATAVTQIVGDAGAAPGQEEPIRIAVDRPYAMMTVDDETGWVLMYVTVTDPTQDPVNS